MPEPAQRLGALAQLLALGRRARGRSGLGGGISPVAHLHRLSKTEISISNAIRKEKVTALDIRAASAPRRTRPAAVLISPKLIQ